MSEVSGAASASPIEPGAFGFAGGWAVVFGGSGGLGRGICLKLAGQGVNIALTYRGNQTAAERIAAELASLGVETRCLCVDVADGAAVAQALSDLRVDVGRFHTVVYAIGADISMSFVAQVDPEEWRRTLDGDLNGFFNVTRASLPILREGGGTLLAITSAGIVRHPPLDILSTVPKAGIEALIRGVAREEGRYGVRANSVAPGMIEAGLFHRLEQRLTPAFLDAARKNTALRRFGSVDDVANAVLFLASPMAAYITGQHLVVDGGYSV